MKIIYIVDSLGRLVSYNAIGQLHSFDDKPSLVSYNGTLYCYKNGQYHRENNLPAIVYPNGDNEYWKNNVRVG